MWENAQKHLATVDEKLKIIISQHTDCTLRKKSNLFEFLIASIASQQLSTKAADTIWGRYAALFEGPISPEKALEIEISSMRAAGLSQAKSSYIHNIAQFWLENDLHDESFDDLSDDDIGEKLITIKGVGRWTADMFLIFALGRPDILPVGDLAIRKSAQKLYNLKELPVPKKLEKLAKPWRPYRSVACWYLYKFLDNLPPLDATNK